MNSKTRIPRIIKKLEKAWKKNPELRLGQLLTAIEKGADGIFYFEDDIFEALLDEFNKEKR